MAAIDLTALRLPAVTVSVGVAVAEYDDEPIGDLVERADRALYRAKRNGREPGRGRVAATIAGTDSDHPSAAPRTPPPS